MTVRGGLMDRIVLKPLELSQSLALRTPQSTPDGHLVCRDAFGTVRALSGNCPPTQQASTRGSNLPACLRQGSFIISFDPFQPIIFVGSPSAAALRRHGVLVCGHMSVRYWV